MNASESQERCFTITDYKLKIFNLSFGYSAFIKNTKQGCIQADGSCATGCFPLAEDYWAKCDEDYAGMGTFIIY